MTGGADTIKELKASILAIEWEINDEAMDNLAKAVGPLKQEWAGRKPFLVCLQVIGTLGKYIKKAKQKAHPEATKLLHSVFSTLENIVTDESMDDSQRVPLVRSELDKYNWLKKELAKPRKVTSAPAEQASSGKGGSTIQELMDQKEDKAVDGAFDSIFQGMVGDEAPPSAPAGMPSSTPQVGEDDKEVVPDRVDDEVFQEADDLLNDFFSDDGMDLSLDDEKPDVAETTGVAEEADETVEVDLGQVEPEEEKAETIAEQPEEIEEEEVPVDNLGKIIQQIAESDSAALLPDLVAEIEGLRSNFPNHYSVLFFLELIASAGRHLEKYPEVAREVSCKMMQGMFDRLSHALFTMQPQQNLLTTHLETLSEYVSWHEQVISDLQEMEGAPEVAAAGTEQFDELPVGMVEAVKDLVHREVAELRQEFLELLDKK